jgi:pantoate--beta-alanine ligase
LAPTDAKSERVRPRVVQSPGLMQGLSMALRAQNQTVGLVPTMGSLHEGHLELVRYARGRCDALVVSLFVNPLQFAPTDDLARYPRNFERDLLLCRREGVDVIFAPDHQDLFPAGFQTRVQPGALARRWEGKSRPQFFGGVATVVSVLFHATLPHFTVFGEKDFQQLAVIKRMVQDLRIPVEVVGRPTVRDEDGIALSSRNAFLSRLDRVQARSLRRSIRAVQELAATGETRGAQLKAAALRILESTQDLDLDYLALVDPGDLSPLRKLDRPARLLLAAQVGQKTKTRLIDNGEVVPQGWSDQGDSLG